MDFFIVNDELSSSLFCEALHDAFWKEKKNQRFEAEAQSELQKNLALSALEIILKNLYSNINSNINEHSRMSVTRVRVFTDKWNTEKQTDKEVLFWKIAFWESFTKRWKNTKKRVLIFVMGLGNKGFTRRD